MPLEFGPIVGITIQLNILQDPQACDRQPPIQVQIESAWRENAPGNRRPAKK